MSSFQDLFSSHATCYAKARPGYPPEMFAYLAGLVPEHRLAWDAGTGNGQAAIGLAEHFQRVIATDASKEQIAQAVPHERIEYRAATAEEADLASASVDLVMIAQALHWFRHDAFYANVRRVSRPHGVIAASCYTLPRVTQAIDAVLDRFYTETTGPFWEPGRRYIDERFETIPFPFDEIRPTPSFDCCYEWTLAEFRAYIESWSAVQKFRKEQGRDPLDVIAGDLAAAWGDPSRRYPVTWPIYLRVGRVR